MLTFWTSKAVNAANNSTWLPASKKSAILLTKSKSNVTPSTVQVPTNLVAATAVANSKSAEVSPSAISRGLTATTLPSESLTSTVAPIISAVVAGNVTVTYSALIAQS